MRVIHRYRKSFVAAIVFMLCAGTATAYADDSSDKIERDATNRSAQHFSKQQPMHQYDHSSIRDFLIAAQDALALGTDSTTVQMLDGVGRTFECPSVGFPVPFGTQLSNPMKKIDRHDVTLPQEEPYGLYPPPDVRATLANCVLPNGSIGIFYSEPDLTTFGFNVEWSEKDHMYKIPSNSSSKLPIHRTTPDEVKVRPIDQP